MRRRGEPPLAVRSLATALDRRACSPKPSRGTSSAGKSSDKSEHSQRTVLVLAGSFLAATASAQEQKAQPPPEFTSYQIPATPAPPPRESVFGLIDVAILALVLGLAAWALLKQRSRSYIRVLSIFSVLYFGFYRLGCVCSVGSIQNVALAVTQPRYAIPLTVGAFFALPLLAALFWGRVFCAAACPLGAIQDLVLIRPKKVSARWAAALETIPYLYLGVGITFAALGSAFLICEYDPFVAFFRFSGHTGIVLFGGVLLALGTVIGRPYCRFLCPYGVLLRWASKVAKNPVKVSPDECITCHLCADACPFDSIEPPTPDVSIDRPKERKRVAWRLALLPLLVAIFAFTGYRAAPTLAAKDLRVERARQLVKEPDGLSAKAWVQQAKPRSEAFKEAVETLHRFEIGMTCLGIWFGLVLGGRLVLLGMRPRRTEYTVDQSACFSCGRCYKSCPVQKRPQFNELQNLLEVRS